MFDFTRTRYNNFTQTLNKNHHLNVIIFYSKRPTDVLVSLVQLVGTMHKICKGPGFKLHHKKKKKRPTDEIRWKVCVKLFYIVNTYNFFG
jgi:hypothetical protein